MTRRCRAVAALGAIVLSATVASPASATFPGANGRIASVVFYDALNPHIKPGLYTNNPDGTGRRLVDARGFNPAWSPSGDMLAWEHERSCPPDAESSGPQAGDTEIRIAGADGSGARTLAKTSSECDAYYRGEFRGAVRPAWSPDGQRLVYDAPDGLTVIGSDGSNPRLLFDGPPEGPRWAAWDPVWSPDGQRIAFVGANPNRDQDQRIHGLWVVNADGSNPRLLVRNPSTGSINRPDWSPDDSAILYTWLSSDPRNSEVRAINPDTGGSVTLPGPTPLLSRDAVWSPDGQGLLAGGHYPLGGGKRKCVIAGAQAAWQPSTAAAPALPGEECLPTIKGTSRNDTLLGRDADDTLCGLRGNDKLRGLEGDDVLYGDACNDRLKPVAGAKAVDGNDKLDGGAGMDILWGAGGGDTLKGGSGRDGLNGGGGNDTVNARDGEKDHVDCGSGMKDSATVDKIDVVKRCEKVTKK